MIAPLILACASPPPAERAGTAADPFVVGVSQCNRNEPWRVQMDADLAGAAAAHPELTLKFKDAQNDALVQRSHVEEFVAQGVDLLIVSPKEAAPLTGPVALAYRAGIPVIVLDRGLEGDAFTTFVGADNVRIGREAGRWLAERLGGEGAIVELKGLMTSTPGQDRHRGFLEGLDLAGHPGLKVVFEGEMRWLEPDARSEMESALARHAVIDAVFAHNDPGAHGAWLAAKAAGREGSMTFVGIDALPHEGVQYVRDGVLDATFAYPTGGAEAIDLATRILRGEDVPRSVVLETRSFTAESVDR